MKASYFKINCFYLNVMRVSMALNAFNAFAQEKISQVIIYGDVKNYVNGISMPGVTIQLTCDGKTVETATSSASGKFKLKPVGIFQNYQLVFSGKNLVSRFVDFELKNIPPDKTYEKWDFELPMKMIEKNDFVDLTVLEKKRSSVIKFNKSSGELDFNTTETENYRKELDRLLITARQKKSAMTNDSLMVAKKNSDKNKNRYDSLILAGKNELSAGNFGVAIDAYTKALELKPTNAFALAQLKRAKELKQESVIANRKMYNLVIQTADKFFGEANYDEAKLYYQRAIVNFNYNEPYPVEQLAACQIKMKPIAVVDSGSVSAIPVLMNTISKQTKATLPAIFSNDPYEKEKYFIKLAEKNQDFYVQKNEKDEQEAYVVKKQMDENTKSISSSNQDQWRIKKINEIEKRKNMPAVVKLHVNYSTRNLTSKTNQLEYGVHEWKTQRVNSKNEPVEFVTERRVVGTDKTDNYKMVKNKWGVSFTKNNRVISEHAWNMETSGSSLIVHE
jgi:hypothetical protein